MDPFQEGLRHNVALSDNTNNSTHDSIAPLDYQDGDQTTNVASSETPPSQANLLNSNIQDLISTINDKRKRDSSLLRDFKKDLDQHCTTLYGKMEAVVYGTYEGTNKIVEGKLKELLDVLNRIGQLECELSAFKDAFSALYSEMHDSKEIQD